MRKQDRHSRLRADYFDRLMVCQANISLEGPIQPQGALYDGVLRDPRCRVRVADVAAVLLSADFTLPDEMRAMVAAVIQANPTPSAAAPAEVVAFDDVRAGNPEPVRHEAPDDAPATLKIQAAAAEIWIRWLANNGTPTVHGILDDVAKWCRDHDVKSKGGVHPSAGTLRNTILGAGHWTPPSMTREEAQRHVAQVARD